MIFTGLRKGEVRFLEWSDVDLDKRLLHVRPKTENGARTIPLCEPAVEALRMAQGRAKKKMMTSCLVTL
jgi:integrase